MPGHEPLGNNSDPNRSGKHLMPYTLSHQEHLKTNLSNAPLSYFGFKSQDKDVDGFPLNMPAEYIEALGLNSENFLLADGSDQAIQNQLQLAKNRSMIQSCLQVLPKEVIA